MPYDAESLFDLPPEPPPTPPPPREHVYSVGELTLEIKDLLEGSYDRLVVEGEISGWKIYRSGHAYFSLKDEDAVISCVMWRTSLARHRALELHDGLAVRAEGRISLYPPRGQYQLVVEELCPAGVGLLQKRFEEMKRKLSEEGLFSEERKRPLPFLPRRIGLVTSPQGAALKDFQKVVKEAQLPLELVLAPCRVQGVEAPDEIARAIAELNRIQGIDTIVVTRGGGSLEDLWAFNEEAVARAIAASEAPVLSAVGHEIDTTIADFVADRRAPTPTGAALLLADIYDEQRHRWKRLGENLERGKKRVLSEERNRLIHLYRTLSRYHPRRVLDERRRRLDDLMDALHLHFARRIEQERSTLDQTVLRLRKGAQQSVWDTRLRLREAADKLFHRCSDRVRNRRAHLVRLVAALHELDPRRILSRGFALAEQPETGKTITDRQSIRVGDSLRVRFSDGTVDTRVESVDGKN